MKSRRIVTQDTVAGLMFAAWGAAALYFGRFYPTGTANEMGPGYFPMVLGWMLIGIGAIITITGLVKSGARLDPTPARAMFFIGGAFLFFAFFVETWGLLITAPLCMLIAAIGGREFRAREQIVVVVLFSIVAAALFVWALRLSIPLLPAR
jgi:hypothetical protein